MARVGAEPWAELEDFDMTQGQAQEFTEFAKEWAAIYCQYHGGCKTTDIPLDIAVAVAEMLVDNMERCKWELSELEREAEAACKLFIYKYKDEATNQLIAEFEEAESDDNV